jgi:hypothetical protein
LPEEKQFEYFSLLEKKIIPAIDNIYFSVFIVRDTSREILPGIKRMVEEIKEKKEQARELRKPQLFKHGLEVSANKSAGNGNYNLCLTNPDLYDIFMHYGKLTNDNTNRIHVQLRALGLHTRGNDAMLLEAYGKVKAVLADYGLEVSKTQENRIDYCYHTNIISGLNKIFFTENGYAEYLDTALTQGYGYFNVKKVFKGKKKRGSRLEFDYIMFGRMKSRNYLVRFYDKAKEVISQGYKSFFFKMWHDNGLISYYDKWCMEYAAPYKNANYYSKAKIAFYARHGTNEEKVEECKKALAGKNTTLAKFEEMATGLMPKITPVMNIEFQTMRRFYKHSDKYINSKLFKTFERTNVPPELERLFKIIDNREVFLKWLTSKGISFYDGLNEKRERKYLEWWKRIRNVKIEGIKADIDLLREYSYSMDRVVVLRQLIHKTSSFAGYDDCDMRRPNFKEHNELALISITDNAAHRMDEKNAPYKDLLEDYDVICAKKEMLLRNRKNKIKQQLVESLKEASLSNTEAIQIDMDEPTVDPQELIEELDDFLEAEFLDDDDDEWIPWESE